MAYWVAAANPVSFLNTTSMTWKDRYRQSKFNHMRKSTPAAFEASGGETMKVNYPKVDTTNGLTKAIIDILNNEGHFAERTNTMGRPVDKRKTYVDVIGRTRIIGSLEWQKGSGTTGSSDIKADINHPAYPFAIPVKIEVKLGKDSMSKAQERYEEKVSNRKIVYVVAKDIDSWILWYDAFMLSLDVK